MVRKKRILVVDDDKTILESLKNILENEDFSVDTAETGNEAYIKLWRRHYHLVIINSRLPDITSEKLKTKINSIRPRIEIIELSMMPIKPEILLKIIKSKLGKLLK